MDEIVSMKSCNIFRLDIYKCNIFRLLPPNVNILLLYIHVLFKSKVN